MTVCSTCKHANYCEIVAGGYSSQVKSCRDYRKGETTNEEWFCRLSTEEKADLLAELVWWIHPSVQGGRKVELTKESFLRWLKEKHDEM